MIHRAILGSLERFMGILIENYAGGDSTSFARGSFVLLCGLQDTKSLLPTLAQVHFRCGWRPCSADLYPSAAQSRIMSTA